MQNFLKKFLRSAQNSCFFRKKALTEPMQSDRIQPKLNRSDRGAGFISTLRQGQAAAGRERENRRSCERLPGLLPLGRRKTSAGLSQTFVKRYHWPLDRPSRAPFRISMDRLTKRSNFYPPGAGDNAPEIYFGKGRFHYEEVFSSAHGNGHDPVPGRLRRLQVRGPRG